MRASKKALVLFVSVSFAAALAAWAQGKEQKVVSDRWYRMLDKGKPLGYLHLVQKESGDPNAPILFVHEVTLKEDNETTTIKVETWCKEDAFFSPVKFLCSLDGAKTTAAVARPGPDSSGAGKIVVTDPEGKQTEKDIPAHTVAGLVILSIVPRLPFDKEKVLSFNWMDIEPKVERDHTLSYSGEEEITLGGQKTKLHKFVQNGEGPDLPWEYWVNDKRELVRVVERDTELLPSTEAEAKKALEGKRTAGVSRQGTGVSRQQRLKGHPPGTHARVWNPRKGRHSPCLGGLGQPCLRARGRLTWRARRL